MGILLLITISILVGGLVAMESSRLMAQAFVIFAGQKFEGQKYRAVNEYSLIRVSDEEASYKVESKPERFQLAGNQCSSPR